MPIDFSFLANAAPSQPEQEPEVKPATTGTANVTVRVDADSFMLCDGEYVEPQLVAGKIEKVQLPTGQHLLEFLSVENSDIKVEKVVDFPESGKSYLVMVNEMKALLAPPMPQNPVQSAPVSNPYLDQLKQMTMMNPLGGMNMPPMPGAVNMPPMPNINDNNKK